MKVVILYESNYRTFWKRQNSGDIETDEWLPGSEGERGGAQGIFRAGGLFCVMLTVDTRPSPHICQPPKNTQHRNGSFMEAMGSVNENVSGPALW